MNVRAGYFTFTEKAGIITSGTSYVTRIQSIGAALVVIVTDIVDSYDVINAVPDQICCLLVVQKSIIHVQFRFPLLFSKNSCIKSIFVI